MIRLDSLTLKNFKGIRKFELRLDGQNATVLGDNATGKTTLYDAFLWLLFDKDSLNRANFGIKTLDPGGEVINGLDHEAEAVLDVNGKALTLKKVFYEKWTKPRGGVVKVFSGHTTSYFVDEVPKNQKEYKDKIAELGDENIFRLLTDPRFFNEQLHWQDRRKMLLEVCGDISDDDVITSDKKLSKLAGLLKERSVDDLKKIVVAKRKKINEQLERVPIRIDEVQNGTPDIEGLDFDDIQAQIEELQSIQDIHRRTISRIESGGEIAKKEKDIALIDADLLKLKVAHEEKKRTALRDLQNKADQLTVEHSKAKRDATAKQDETYRVKNRIAMAEKTVQALRDEWHKLNAEQFEMNQDTVCPACGQDLPHEHLEVAREKALKAFNLIKSKKLEKISEEGKSAAAELADLKISYNALTEEYEGIRQQLEAIKGSLDDINLQISHVKDGFEDISSLADYKVKVAEKEQLKNEVSDLKAGNSDEVQKIRSSIASIDMEIRELQTDLAKKDQAEKAKARIHELESEEKTLAAELEELDEQMYLTEEFTKTKVSLLESKINSKFQMARFKLFDVQVNGGINECCETVFEGVPYGDLNNAARINIGLDIINTLTEHYSFSAPIFVDNRESVTRLTEVDAQVISLVVSNKDKKLRVELEPSVMKEAI